MDEPKFVIEECNDEESVARFRAGQESFLRNSEWLQAHWNELIPQVYDKHLAVAGQEAFFGDDPKTVLAQARAAHPDDHGIIFEYVRRPIGPRIYGNRG
jgi:hypothetical protein